jgi:hypothetical protein
MPCCSPVNFIDQVQMTDEILGHRSGIARNPNKQGRGLHSEELAKFLPYSSLHLFIIEVEQLFLQ